MKLGIVTDSTCDLPNYLIEQHGLEVVPSILILDGKEYADGIGLSREDFYNRLAALPSQVTTAAPSIGDFASRYDSFLSRGCDHILSIHAAGTLTAIINVARQAANDFPNKVTLVDSGSLSLGLGFQVLAAAESADDGLQAALDAVESTRKRLSVFAALDTMENLKRSGRVPSVVAQLGGLLSIKPVVEIKEGNVKPIGATRTTKQSDERMLNLALEAGEMERLAILHTNAEARAKNLLNGLMDRQRMSVPRDILFVNVTAVIGTHLGANGLGFAAVRSESSRRV
ncbi:MAG: DegV family protein [Anaerolineales bacterium]|nr:DegV family protein [Anaerolineales bacterium]